MAGVARGYLKRILLKLRFQVAWFELGSEM